MKRRAHRLGYHPLTGALVARHVESPWPEPSVVVTPEKQSLFLDAMERRA
ncbi:MAG: hypothetical protein ACR2LS_06050 [Thermomicrobiales bacterium]